MTIGRIAVGLWKEKDSGGAQDNVRVRYDDGEEKNIPAEDYRANGYAPLIEELPWKPE